MSLSPIGRAAVRVQSAVEASLRLAYPDHITPAGARIIRTAVQHAVEQVIDDEDDDDA